MDARVTKRLETAIREAYARHVGPSGDWVALKVIAGELPGVGKSVLEEVLTALVRRDEAVLASNPARATLTQADHDWAIHGRHLLHVRPDADQR